MECNRQGIHTHIQNLSRIPTSQIFLKKLAHHRLKMQLVEKPWQGSVRQQGPYKERGESESAKKENRSQEIQRTKDSRI